jgi:hypothetical protein
MLVLLIAQALLMARALDAILHGGLEELSLFSPSSIK